MCNDAHAHAHTAFVDVQWISVLKGAKCDGSLGRIRCCVCLTRTICYDCNKVQISFVWLPMAESWLALSIFRQLSFGI